ncbi:MAG: amino acid permease [bacterium]|nr:amino acid permease [bacterium]
MKTSTKLNSRARLGTGAVFLTAFTTILGAIMFLRFGYAVAHVGLFETLLIILLGHAVTIPTAMAIAEIATNQRVEGGGEYYIVSRSFGIPIGASIGTGLYLARAISIAFYLIAFAEAFDPFFVWLSGFTEFPVPDSRMVSVPVLCLLFLMIYTRGAGTGAALLYVIVAVLCVALFMFFGGDALEGAPAKLDLYDRIQNPDSFFIVFAIVFPAFTGMTAGVGLSGDLKNPRSAIPVGTMAATIIGMLIYMAVAYKLAISASPEELAGDQLIMSDISTWGPIIPIGLACAALSSALGSIMVAPRTLQAMANDHIFGSPVINRNLARISANNEPRSALIVTFVVALFFTVIGDVDFVAGIITMFFMLTYGGLCLVSFMEHFAADPSYRPTFQSRWYISLASALLCFWLMFRIDAAFTLAALVFMVFIHVAITRANPGMRGMASIFQGVIFQVARTLQIILQKSATNEQQDAWRPAVVCLSERSFERFDAFDLLRWISHTYGFGTYIHMIRGYLSRSARTEADEALTRLVRIANISKSNVYFDTIVSPSYTTAVAQVLQLPGITGKDNNTTLFEFQKNNSKELTDIVDNYQLINATDFDILILASSPKKFGYMREIHVWITENDYENANLMILLAYIILGHPDWRGGVIKIRYIAAPDKIETERERLTALVKAGRLPISSKHIAIFPRTGDRSQKDIINENSGEADLTMVGFRGEMLKQKRNVEYFDGYESIGNLLFVNTTREKEIK